MNIQHRWSIICSGVSIDQQSNNLSLFNIIEQIRIPKNHLVEIKEGGEKKLVIPVPFNLINLWSRASSDVAEKVDVEIKLIDPSGKARKVGAFTLKFDSKIERIRSKSQYSGIKASSSGVYTFRMYVKEKGQEDFRDIGSVHLNVEILPSSRIDIKKESKNK
ncbi:MAG: hypothetical protein NTW60_01900 [Candidatus Wolfebacteria bacterium]|nr:hypothetical protein [Candidatus Wolfebacteria bacterium]